MLKVVSVSHLNNNFYNTRICTSNWNRYRVSDWYWPYFRYHSCNTYVNVCKNKVLLFFIKSFQQVTASIVQQRISPISLWFTPWINVNNDGYISRYIHTNFFQINSSLECLTGKIWHYISTNKTGTNSFKLFT